MDNMQLWLSSSTDSINLNDRLEGFYLNPDLDGLTGLPEIRSVNGLNAGYDGGWTATQLWAARLITIRGVIAINDKAAVETKRKALAKLLSQGKNEDLELKFVSEAGNTYTATVRTTNCTMALQRVFWRQEYQIQLRANDPLIYDDGGSELVAILRVMSGEGGFEIPFDIPFDIGGTVTPTSVDVGDEATYPLIRLKGDLHSPTIISLTTNQRMQVLADIITTTEWHDYTTTYTISGYTQITSDEDGAPLSLTHLYGNAEQKTLSGKNICSNATVAGNTSIRFYFNKTNSTNLVLSAITNAATTSASVYLVVDSTEIARIGAFSGGANQRGFAILTLTQAQIDTIQAGTRSWLNLYVGGGTFSSVSEAQIEAGSTVSPYEPYVGGIPSPNPDYPQAIKTITGAQTVKITGKNQFDYVSASDADNTTVTQYRVFRISGLIPNATYTMNGQTASQNTDSSLFVYLWSAGTYPDSKYKKSLKSDAGAVKFGANENGEIYLAIYPTDAATWASTLSTYFGNTQLELGTTATAYEPYQGQIQEINLGKNLFDISKVLNNGNNTLINNGDGTLTVKGIAVQGGSPNTLADYCPTLKEGDVATFNATSTSTVGYIYLYGANTTWNYGASKTITSAMLESHVAWYGTSGGGDTISNIQLELGTQATSYSPYKTPLELAKIGDYADEPVKVDGAWYIRRAIGKVVLNGTETWNKFASDGKISFYTNVADGTGNIVLSDNFSCTKTGGFPDLGSILYNGGSNKNMLFRMTDDTTITQVADFKTWLGAHNTTVYYVLATPTDEEITDSELIEQLNHIYELYQGTNNVMLIPNAGAQGEMTVTYATAVDRDYHEVVIDCQARTVTQNGRNLYPALADGSEFIRLLPGENRLYLTSEVESDNGTAEVKFKKGNISI